MKQILFTLIITAAAHIGFTQTQQANILNLKETIHDFGKIQQSRPVTYDFEFANNSADTLKIENVQASCGCTTPVWKREPVAPGAISKITVGYNAAAEGNFEKTITIFYNGNQTKMMQIKGTVYKAPETPAPVNPSLQIIKQSN